MSAQKWTPEPWAVDPKKGLRVVAQGDNTVATTGCTDSLRDQWEANAARAVACVNALAGRDPSKLAALEAACDDILNDRSTNLRAALAAFRGQP